MKRVLVIGSKNSGTKNNPEVMAHSFQQNGMDANVLHWENLVFEIKTGQVSIVAAGQELAELKPDLVIALNWYKSGSLSFYKDVAYGVALYLKHHDITFWNSEMLHQRSTSKLSCMVELALENISVPHTLYSMSRQLIMERNPKLPAIVKSFAASRGANNFLIKNLDELAKKVPDDENTFLVQPFLDNDHDLRVICVGGEPTMVLRHSRAADSGTHLNNVSQGGSGEWLELPQLPESLLTECRKICIVMHRELAGIDFIPDTSSPYQYSCLEVNAVPQLTSGTDVETKLDTIAQALAKYARSE